MNNGELYINGRLVDAPADLGIRLNRKLIDPGALNTVDAQFSYSITLPPTARNNEIFNYANVEETRDKFNRVYVAEYIANSVRVFGPNGLFRLTSVTAAGYKGNLYKPSPKTIKDIFGEIKLTDNPSYLIPFEDFVEYVNLYNNAAFGAPQPAIFPYVLYGLIPKVPTNKETNEYSPRNVWDDTARIGITDFAPAINTLNMLKHIFAGQGYDLQGTAFSDNKLKQLYQSYKNAADYVQPWNYGRIGVIHVSGSWSNFTNSRDDTAQLEKGTFQNADFITDMFDATNTALTVVNDPGGNVFYNEVDGEYGKTWVSAQIRVPASGFYKLQFHASIKTSRDNVAPVKDPDTGIPYIGGGGSEISADFRNTLFEMRVCRDNGKGDFGLSGAHTDGVFYKNNQPQNDVFDADNLPKYFPQVDALGQINFVDSANDENVIVGCMFGNVNQFTNPKDDAEYWAQVYAAKPAYSWDGTQADNPLTRLAIASPGWWKYGYNDDFTAIDYETTNKYAIDLINAPQNFAVRGKFNGADADDVSNGETNAAVVVWLEAGELITVAHVASTGTWKDGPFTNAVTGTLRQSALFDLQLQPFRIEPEWLQVNTAGNGTGSMDWEDPTTFTVDEINLVGFLNADTKTDDFIDNFCKAFNLNLWQAGAKTFRLDLKQNKTTTSNLYVDLDGFASVRDRENAPLGLPSAYNLGFTIEKEEEGYVETGEDGGGTFRTGATEELIVTQTSNFSYGWYKDITKTETAGDIIIKLPIISKSEVWGIDTNYGEAMLTRYTDLAQRFFYFAGILPGTYAYNGDFLAIAQVSNEIPGISVLDYKNKLYSILYNYFNIIVSGASHYTTIKGYLEAFKYAQLDGTLSVRFNGDLYFIAEISAYDPLGKNQTTCKLIRKI